MKRSLLRALLPIQ